MPTGIIRGKKYCCSLRKQRFVCTFVETLKELLISHKRFAAQIAKQPSSMWHQRSK